MLYKFILNRESKREIIGGVAREISLDKNLQLEFESNLMSYSNIDEEKRLLSEEFREKAADAVAEGICNYCSITNDSK